MPLFIQNDSISREELGQIASTRMLYEKYPKLHQICGRMWYASKSATPSVHNLKNEPVFSYDPERVPALYVLQHELAIVSATDDKVQFILTDDATTCVTGIVYNRTTNMTMLCHFDRILMSVDIKYFRDFCLPTMSSHNPDDQFELVLIGGYLDERNISEKLVLQILQMFHSIESFNIHLQFLLVGHLNTQMRLLNEQGEQLAFPIITGIMVDVKSGQIMPAKLHRNPNDSLDQIPLPLFKLRRTYISYGDGPFYRSIYDCHKQMIRIEPLTISPHFFTSSAKFYFKEKLKLTDQQLLNFSSTSPMVEQDHFVKEVREVLSFMYEQCQSGTNSTHLNHEQYYVLEKQAISTSDGQNSHKSEAVLYKWNSISP